MLAAEFAESCSKPVSSLTTKDEPDTLTGWCHLVLSQPNPIEKVALTRRLVALFRSGQLTRIGDTPPPDEPVREIKLSVLDPGKMAKRGKGGSERSRIALLHSVRAFVYQAAAF